MELPITRSDLMDAILHEMNRVWGEDSFSGAWVQYDWLLKTYGVTEDDDFKWLGILEYEADEVHPEDAADPEWMGFVTDDAQVIPFLQLLLKKYRSRRVVAPANLRKR
jgi:hypothetical protein